MIATKFGFEEGDSTKGLDSRPARIRQVADEALNRLRTDVIDDFRSIVPRFSPEALKANQKLVQVLGRIADDKGITPAQTALAWLRAQKSWIVPIPGTTKLSRLEENVGAIAVALTPEELAKIEKALAAVEVHGDRYPAHLKARVGR